MQSANEIATSPEQIHEIFVEAFKSGDLDRLMTLYEPDAANMPEPGQVARGARQIREALQHLMQRTERMTFDAKAVIVVGDQWTMTSSGPDGRPVTDSAVAAEVARRGPDGGWRFVIGNPWGDRVAD